MALKVETIPALTRLPPMVVLIEGKPKTGKTTAALTWPKPLLVDFPTEDGATFHAGTQRVMVRTWDELAEVPGLAKDFDTVVIDTLQAMWHLLTGGRKLELQEYGEHYAKFTRALQRITAAGKHVVLVSHTKDLFSGKGKDAVFLRSVAMLPGQLAERVAGFADQILHSYVNDHGGYYIRCKAGDQKEAGGRLRELPAFYEWRAGSSIFKGLEKAFDLQNKPDQPAKNSKK